MHEKTLFILVVPGVVLPISRPNVKYVRRVEDMHRVYGHVNQMWTVHPSVPDGRLLDRFRHYVSSHNFVEVKYVE